MHSVIYVTLTECPFFLPLPLRKWDFFKAQLPGGEGFGDAGDVRRAADIEERHRVAALRFLRLFLIGGDAPVGRKGDDGRLALLLRPVLLMRHDAGGPLCAEEIEEAAEGLFIKFAIGHFR